MKRLKPRLLWKRFLELSAIPRLSGHEEGARRWIRNWAAEHGFGLETDDAGNIAVHVSEGVDCREPITLQAHLDMVGATAPGVSFDFETEGILPRQRNGWVSARGTSLGADNGIGVAAALAVSEQERRCWPLDLLFTVEEERGCVGARGLDVSLIRGSKLINLDSEEEALFIGCAGARDCQIEIPVVREDQDDYSENVVIGVGDLHGGHSGTMIHKEHSNAIQLLGSVLRQLEQSPLEFKLSALVGGDGRNTIPSSSSAHLRVRPRILAALRRKVEAVRREVLSVIPERTFSLSVDPAASLMGAVPVLAAGSQRRVLAAIEDCPHGVLAMSAEALDTVETSSNLATIRTKDDEVILYTMSRSANDCALDQVIESLRVVAAHAGGRCVALGGYPGWQPDLESELLACAERAFERIRGEPPTRKSVHAGLECGVIGARYGGLDMVSIGPCIEQPHTPKERVFIESVQFFYDLLVEILSELRSNDRT